MCVTPPWSTARGRVCRADWGAQWFRFEVAKPELFRGCLALEANPELIGGQRARASGGCNRVKGCCPGSRRNASLGTEARTYHGLNRTEVLGLGVNPAFACFVGVPYFTGIFAPTDNHTVAPWTLTAKRSALLGYFGSVNRHVFRARFHDLAWPLARALESGNETGPAAGLRGLSDQPAYAVYYRAPLQDGKENMGGATGHKSFYAGMRTDSAFARSWTVFATSVFCWQPGGDTPTRRSFYDAWLFGCIPVITECAVSHYERLFGGHFFSHHKGATLADVVVVVPDSAEPRAVFRTLLSLTNADVAKRRMLLHTLAPFLQWSASTSKSAIRMFFGSVRHEQPRRR